MSEIIGFLPVSGEVIPRRQPHDHLLDSAPNGQKAVENLVVRL
jgi:hypothetical protein